LHLLKPLEKKEVKMRYTGPKTIFLFPLKHLCKHMFRKWYNEDTFCSHKKVVYQQRQIPDRLYDIEHEIQRLERENRTYYCLMTI